MALMNNCMLATASREERIGEERACVHLYFEDLRKLLSGFYLLFLHYVLDLEYYILKTFKYFKSL